jgi:RNA polymerase sigma-70 factor (ECF subfamily)
MTKIGSVETIMAFAAKGEERSNVVPFSAATADECLALTQRVASGDEAAAREFFEKYCDRIFRYALVVTRGNEELAREILSITMIKAARYMRALPSDEDVWRWLTRIARSCFVDHCRKTRRIVPVVESDEILSRTATPTPDTTLNNALNEALSELPLEDRELVERFYIDDETQTALAEDIQSTRKAVESRLARIRRKLRAAIIQKLS